MKIACIQMNSGPEIEANLAEAEIYIREAAEQGAEFISTPENTCHMLSPQTEKLKSAFYAKDHPAYIFFSALAKELGVWIQAGSISVKVAEDKIANRSLLFDAQGDIVAEYDKMHLFDVDLAGGESYRESSVVQAGDKAALAETPFGTIGLTICYDLRFPYLYRDLAHKGATILTVPSAFTVPTGRAHWESLLRARAIENGCFVVAAAQCGEHHGGRKTYGHSMIIGPWGEVLAEADGQMTGVLMADIDLDEVSKARAAVPSLQHDRAYN
jgi:predicted amidohydrolase